MLALNTTRISRTAPLYHRTFISAVVAFCLLSLAACDMWIGADKRVQRAEQHLAKGQFRPAMAELKTALQNEPEHVGARVALAQLSFWLGDLAGAEKEMNRAVAAGATDDLVRPTRYQVLLEQGKFEDLEKLLETDSTMPELRRLVIEARIAQARGDRSQAQEKLQSALEADPADPEALFESARLAAAKGDGQPALDLPERISQAGEIYARALLLRGAVLMDRGEHSQARDAFVRAQDAGKRLRAPEQLTIATALTEANLALNDVEAADKSLLRVAAWGQNSLIAHYLRARIAMLKNDYIAAVTECQRALRVEPRHMQSQILLAAAHLGQGSMEQAEEVLTRLLASNPNNTGARKLLAQVYLGRNQPEQAQQVLASAGLEADSDADWLMGAALMKSGSVETAVPHLERSVAAEPDNMARKIDLAGAYIAARMPDRAIELLKGVPAESAAAPRAKVLLVLATAAGKPHAESIREVEELLENQPDDAVLMSVAGAYLAGVGAPDRAKKVLERAIKLDSQSIAARLSLARLELGSRNVNEAERLLREVIKIEPSHDGARIALAEIAWGTGDRAQSRKWLEDAVSADPSTVEARLRLAQLAFVEGDAPRARGLLDQALSVAQDRKLVLTAVGQVLARAGLNDEALARFGEASAAGDTNGIIEASRLHLEMGQPRKARSLIEPALASRPNWREAEQILIVIDARDGKVETALQRAKALAGNAPSSTQRMLEGDIYSIAGRAERAIVAYEAAQKEQPSGQLALKIFRLRRTTGAGSAEKSLTQWLQQTPEDADVRRVLAAHYESSGRVDLALQEYEKLLAEGRLDAAGLNNLAWVLHEKEDPRALALAERAYSAAPNYPAIGDTYGWILVQMGKVAEGLTVLEKALANAPSNPDIQYHAAVAYAKSGQNARATELLNQSLQSAEKFQSREAAERLLQSVTAAKT